MGQYHKPEVPVSGRSRRPAIDLEPPPARSSKAVIQPGRKCKAKEFNGLAALAAATFRTWIKIIVVLTSECSSNSCTVRMSVPDCNKCAAKLWRKVYTETGLQMPACATAFFSARCNRSL